MLQIIMTCINVLFVFIVLLVLGFLLAKKIHPVASGLFIFSNIWYTFTVNGK